MPAQTLLRDLISSSEKRSCGVAIHLRHKTDRHKHVVVGAFCKSWDCDKCRPHLQRGWLEHLSPLFLTQDSLYVSLVAKTRWATVATRIRRAGAQFVTVEQESGMLTVFTTLPDGEKVAPSSAISMLEKAIHNVLTDHRPIHTSRGWGFPKDVVGKASDWERVQKLRVPVDEVREAVSGMGLDTHWFWSGCRTGFLVVLPDSWGEDELEGFSERLEELCKTEVLQ